MVAVGSVVAVKRTYETFAWRGNNINFRCQGSVGASPVLLVHGFGASIAHYRKSFDALVSSGFRVYAIDLLGFGASAKPDLGVGNYNLELWGDLVVDFIESRNESQKWKLCGNSIGSLVVMLAAVALGEDKVAGACLINCAGGLTSFRLNELNPIAATLLVIFNAALFNRYTGKFFFQRFKTRENVRKVLEQAYAGGRDAVTAELVSILCQPADDEGAAEVFLAVLNGPPGPTPRDLLQSLTWCPVLVLWGNDDPFTPYARGAYPGIEFPNYHPTLQLVDLGSVGHCPHDSAPTQTHRHLIPFLKDPQTFRADSHL